MKKKLTILLIFALVVIPLVIVIAWQGNQGSPVAKAGKLGSAIGVIRVEGEISGGSSGGGLFGGPIAGSEDLMEQIRQARSDQRIKAVLLRINSPGGSVPASQEIGEELDRLHKSGKKIVVSMGDMAASGGYWLSAKADYIVANPGTLTGSIGVIMEMQNLQQLYDKVGVDPEVIKSGALKDIGSPNRKLTTQERQLLQDMVNDMYEQFVDVVAKGRHMDKAAVRKLADGRIFTGRQAKKLGLVDELGNYYTALDATKRIAGIQGQPQIIELGSESPFAQLFKGMGSSVTNLITTGEEQNRFLNMK